MSIISLGTVVAALPVPFGCEECEERVTRLSRLKYVIQEQSVTDVRSARYFTTSWISFVARSKHSSRLWTTASPTLIIRSSKVCGLEASAFAFEEPQTGTGNAYFGCFLTVWVTFFVLRTAQIAEVALIIHLLIIDR